MDFLLWAIRAVHLFGVVVWLGALLYLSAIVLPRWGQDGGSGAGVLAQLGLFLPFQWMGLVTVLVSGTILMLFNPRFVFFSYPEWWSVALGLKQAAFLLMCLFSFGYARMAANLRAGTAEEPIATQYRMRLVQFNRLNVALGIVSLLLAASMV
jgi:uncharacterized membrane protein